MSIKVLHLKLAIRDYQEESIANEFYNSHIGQQGIYNLGHEVRRITKDEWEEIYANVPEDIIEEAMEE